MSVPRNQLRLIAILAHPDDETLGVGGVLARYAAEGVGVHVLTATRGEGGRYLEHRDGPGHPGREKLGEIREAELRAAAAVLGVRDVAVLGYPDGGLDRADPVEVIGRIAGHLRRVRPHVAITFAPDGGYGHPDHIAISQFAAAAIVAAADPSRMVESSDAPPHAVSKFYYMASTLESWKVYQAAFKKLTSHVDGVEREALPWPDWQITTWIDTRDHWTTVTKAVQCHYSQTSTYQVLASLSPEQQEQLWGGRGLYRAMSLVNGGRKRETDVFEGLRD